MSAITPNCVFVLIQCNVGATFAVADAIVEKEVHSELHSISGEYDLLLKMYIPSDEDVGRYIGEHLHSVPGIMRTHTILAFSTI